MTYGSLPEDAWRLRSVLELLSACTAGAVLDLAIKYLSGSNHSRRRLTRDWTC
jgi:hypothetical protein